MSSQPPLTPAKKTEHGTTVSYIVGFILSLVLTFNAYFLVVGHLLRGNALLLAILLLGVLQMAVQLLFFLHLGRGPKPLYNIVFFFATASIIMMTIGASLFIMGNLYRNADSVAVTQKIAQSENIAQVGGVATGACQEVKNNYQVTVKDGKVSPAYIVAQRCDSLTILNEDASGLDIVFGTPPTRQKYGGEDGISVRGGYPETITLNQSGDFTFYDTANPALSGNFSVAP